MNKRLLFCLYFTLLFSNSAYSQIKIYGKVWNDNQKTPIAFANIGIPNTPVGTISNEDGSFSILIPQKYLTGSLQFSALGYSTQFVSILSMQTPRNIDIFLSENIFTLKEVTVTAKKEKKKVFRFGNSHFTSGNLYADSSAAGAAIALLIDNKHSTFKKDLAFPLFLDHVKLWIFGNTIDTFKIRIRIYDVDTISGLPGKDLLNKSIVIHSSIDKGWLNINLASTRFVVEKLPFFLVVEWIQNDKDRLALLNEYQEYKVKNPHKVTVDTTIIDGKKIGIKKYDSFYVGTLFGASYSLLHRENYKTYYRENSFGTWNRSGGALTANVFLSNQTAFENIVNAK